ncbi:MAG: DNA repair protein RecO [Candidatus Muproteobacteria bacterium RIFCSPHIGHO2_12_FULL_60_33]|uniref:DNA repair protein RecO n=1 Tax=Candidatus Muproteobacteria bacterium RIFCSPLOWO2_01_FULL_60_18 TaxID=1817768 RepID=A0A1F6TYJ8_9PROT|nr:MAG: DNA repair protein RecO [Candidatus Muproteobacteria bacterium RIFCSPLOWO2_01_FULL_60_18]OGI53158.1 MAG: DNA repair protein RecO [Candidatus Muproteobacteria bacterium RIFCSPHIGHO2_01_60_12]OGI56539.1 MAG: DNA repair protein RecO [Candidatus Muproteobacteria bacterium RIFCSPHIGHO2_02_FULL_60_13]OGI56601.1 MAG: DNA repair protein RecO [Candidatus Muproteobacteria bacterium RIFCSPHIGHO2_12_FULL_60_33]OGI59425.1 MAG: DNA repair protein RecO [Candidatus Muproteobacteria bacterium RIFCSPHIGH
MRVHQQPALVLHQRDYSETSLLLEVFTANHGRIGLIAKGARRASSRLRGVLKPFQPLLIGWSGKGELAVLTAAETDGPGYSLEGPALYCGFYMNEVLLRLLHRHDPHNALFDAYQAALQQLRRDASNESVLRIFEKNLLRELGYGLVLDQDIEDKTPIDTRAMYDYILDRGPMRLAYPELNRPTEGVQIRGSSLLALAQESLSDPVALRDAKALMRAALARHLGDRPLHSRKLFRRVVPLSAMETAMETGLDKAGR